MGSELINNFYNVYWGMYFFGYLLFVVSAFAFTLTCMWFSSYY